MRLGLRYTPAAAQQRGDLHDELCDRLDALLRGVCLEPAIGLWDAHAGCFNAHVGPYLRVTYRLLGEPAQQVLVVQIAPLSAAWSARLKSKEKL